MRRVVFKKIRAEFTPRFSLLLGTPNYLLHSRQLRGKIGATYFIEPYVEHLSNLELHQILDWAVDITEKLQWFQIAACTPEPYGLLRQYILARLPLLTMVEQSIINGGSYG
jgi:hypothetical protein